MCGTGIPSSQVAYGRKLRNSNAEHVCKRTIKKAKSKALLSKGNMELLLNSFWKLFSN